MKTVLVVDDEKPFLLSLSDGLGPYVSQFAVLTAFNGKEAVALLESQPVDLVVTDLKMPVMDGFELLAFLSRRFPRVPVIVMTAFGTPEIEERIRHFGAFHFVEKPLDFGLLLDRITETLSEGSKGFIRGFNLATFIQLIEMERKTCTLKVTSGDQTGHLSVRAGILVDAQLGALVGEEAAFEILCWNEAEIELRSLVTAVPRINAPLQFLLMEAYRRQDERHRTTAKVLELVLPEDDGAPVAAPPAATDAPVASTAGEAPPPEALASPPTIDGDDGSATSTLTKEMTMALDKHLLELKEIKGYKAAGIMNFTGETLVSDSIDANIDLAFTGATFNDIFRTAHAACETIGLEACKEATFLTPKGIVLMRCSGTKAKTHFHLIAVLAADGNQALAKMKLERMVPPLLDEFA